MTELKIIEEKENLFFNRKEIQGLLEAPVTPSYKEVRQILSKKFSAPLETIKINLIGGEFGKQEFKLQANIYKTKEDLESTEKKSKKEIEAEKAEAEEKAAAEAPKEEPKTEEAPAEENKEESTEEIKEEQNK